MFKQKNIRDQQELANFLHLYNQYQLLKCLTSSPISIFVNNSQRSMSKTPRKPKPQAGRNQNQTNSKYKNQKRRRIQTLNSKNKVKHKNTNLNTKTNNIANFQRQTQDQFERELDLQVRQFDGQIQRKGQIYNSHLHKQHQKAGLTNMIEQLAFGPKHRNKKENSHFQDTNKFSFKGISGQNFRNHNEHYDYNNEPTPRLYPTTNNVNNRHYDNSNLQVILLAIFEKHQNSNKSRNHQFNSVTNLKYKQESNAFLDSSQNYNIVNVNQNASYLNSSQATFNNQNPLLRQNHLTNTPNNYNNMSFEQQNLQENSRQNMNQIYKFESPTNNLTYLHASRQQRSKVPLGISFFCNQLIGQSRSSHSKNNRQSRLQMERLFYQPNTSPIKNKEKSLQKISQVGATTKKVGTKLTNQMYQQIEREFKSDVKKQVDEQKIKMLKKKRLERQQQVKNLQRLRSDSNQEEDSVQQDSSQESQQHIYQQNTNYKDKSKQFKSEPISTTTKQISQNIFSRQNANNQAKFCHNKTERKEKQSQKDKDLTISNYNQLKESANCSTSIINSPQIQANYKNKIEIPFAQQQQSCFQNLQNFNRKKLLENFTRDSQPISQISRTKTIARPVEVHIYTINENPTGKREKTQSQLIF